MANLTSNQSLYRYLRKLIEQHIVTEDDALIFEAFQHNEIQHACQAIRDVDSDDVELQHLTIRYGTDEEKNIYQFDLSEEFSYCLDLFSLTIALRQAKFQQETFHPDLISSVVVPIRAEALLWGPGKILLEQVARFHKKVFVHVILSLQVDFTTTSTEDVAQLVELIRGKDEDNPFPVWFEISDPTEKFQSIAAYKPDMLKILVPIATKADRSAFLPVMRFLRQHKFEWVAGRVASQVELNQYRVLGASYYFGYLTDIPTPLSFQSFDKAKEDFWS